jgi:hypothetical protein
MRLVVDTNRIIAALVKDPAIRQDGFSNYRDYEAGDRGAQTRALG